jgi:hypothetical protein
VTEEQQRRVATEIRAVLAEAEEQARSRPIDAKTAAMLVRERELLGRARTSTEEQELQHLQATMPEGPQAAAVRKLLGIEPR